MQTKAKAKDTNPFDNPSSLPLPTIRPQGAKVLLRRDPKTLMSGSIHLPEMKLKNSDHAEVLAVGPACKLGLQPGDRVVISRFSDMDFWKNGHRLLIIPEADVMAVEA